MTAGEVREIPYGQRHRQFDDQNTLLGPSITLAAHLSLRHHPHLTVDTIRAQHRHAILAELYPHRSTPRHSPPQHHCIAPPAS